MWRLSLVLLVCVLGASVAAAESQHPVFYPKRFYDVGPNGDTVSAEGALVGNDVAYKNNRVSITCFKATGECWEIKIEVEGNKVLGIGGPVSYAISEWNKDVVVTKGRNLCSEEVWALDRIQKIARFNRVPLFEEQYCKQPTMSLTIGNPLPENAVYGNLSQPDTK